MSFTSSLGDPREPTSLGGKAGNLGRLARLGLPVPPGFVVESSAFAALGTELSGPVARADAAARRAALLAAPLPAGLAAELEERWRSLAPAGEALIVRSSALGEDSAAASFAGQLDSIFPVASLAELENALRHCWASYFSDRCLAYQESGRGRLQGMAVLVQLLVPARFSGVLFTRSPTGTGKADSMLGEYCLGLGEALVQGELDPGRFTLEGPDHAARFEVELAEKPPLAALAELGKWARQCEELFGGRPQDLEWCLDAEDRLFLLQSRPLTTLGPAPRTATGAAPGRRVVWSNANVNENFPAPISPLLYSVAATGYRHYFRNLAQAFGVSARRQHRLAAAFEQIIGVHGGRMYYHLSHIHQILRGVPGGEFLARSFDDFVGAESTAAAGPPPPTRLSEVGWMALQVARHYRNVRARVGRFEARIEAYCQTYSLAALPRLGKPELRAGLRDFLEIRRHRWNDAALADAAAMVTYGLLGRGLGRLFPDDPGLLHDLLKGLPNLVSGHPARDLWKVAEKIRALPACLALFQSAQATEIVTALRHDPALAEVARAFAAYQAQWGFRCSGELMLTQPGLDEKPEELVELLRAYLRSENKAPEALLAEHQAARLERTAAMLAALRGRRRLLRWPLRALVRATQVAIELRERARLEQARLYNRLRHLALAIGRGWVADGLFEREEDVFFFTIEELDELLAGGAMYLSRR